MAEYEFDLIHESLLDHQITEIQFPHLIPQNIMVERFLTERRDDAEVRVQNKIAKSKETVHTFL